MTETNPTAPSPTGNKPKVNQSSRTFAVLVLVVVVGAALGVWWFSHRDAAARSFAESFIRDMSKGDLVDAKARCVPNIDAGEMERLSGHMVREWGEIHLLDLSGTKRIPQADGTTRIDIAGQLEFDNDLRKAFTATIIQQSDGTMKISSYKFE